jgi:hypothetical protein
MKRLMNGSILYLEVSKRGKKQKKSEIYSLNKHMKILKKLITKAVNQTEFINAEWLNLA